MVQDRTVDNVRPGVVQEGRIGPNGDWATLESVLVASIRFLVVRFRPYVRA